MFFNYYLSPRCTTYSVYDSFTSKTYYFLIIKPLFSLNSLLGKSRPEFKKIFFHSSHAAAVLFKGPLFLMCV